jgi:hypothetical protein
VEKKDFLLSLEMAGFFEFFESIIILPLAFEDDFQITFIIDLYLSLLIFRYAKRYH